MRRFLFKTILTVLCLSFLGVLGIAAYNSTIGLRLRAQLGQTSGQFQYALMLYDQGDIGDAIGTMQTPLKEGYPPAIGVICGLMNDYQAIAPTPEGCVSMLEQTPQKRLAALTDSAIWALEWDVAQGLLNDRLADGDLTAHFDQARFLVLSQPDSLDVTTLIDALAKANDAQDPRGQYAYIVATLNANADGALSPILVEILRRKPSLSAGDAYFELAKLIQTGAISSDLDYVEILTRADRLGTVYAAGYLAQYYLSNPDLDPTGGEQSKWLAKAAAQGDSVAQYNIAFSIIDDAHNTRPISDAIALLDQSASAGFAPAMTLLGVTLWKDPSLQNAPEQDVRERAVTLLQSAAERNDVNALFNLGSLLASQNKAEQAAVYLQQAAALGHVPSQSMLIEIGATQ